MKRRRSRTLLPSLLVLSLIAAGWTSEAATKNWSYVSGSSNWLNGVNWSGGVPVNGDDVVIDGGYVELTNDTANLNSLLVSNSASLLLLSPPTNGVAPFGLVVSVTGNLSVVVNSTIYPYSDNTNGGSSVVYCSNLTVDVTSGFDANQKGFRGGIVNTPYNPPGFGPGASLGVANGAGGAGYGGEGGLGQTFGGPTYGSYLAPGDPGSGSAGSQGCCGGASGGGLIRVEAIDSVIMDGSMMANGQDRVAYSGGGSGGGIYLKCRTFEGSGVFEATGGFGRDHNPNAGGGGGGGGRIAIEYDPGSQAGLSSQPTATFNAAGGNRQTGAGTTIDEMHNALGRPGTVYFADNTFFDLGRFLGGEIRVPGVTSWATNSLIMSGGVVAFPTGFTFNVSQDLTLTAEGGVDFSNSVVNIGGDLIINSDGRASATFHGGADQQINLGTNVTVDKGWFSVSQDDSTDLLISVVGDCAFNSANFYFFTHETSAGTFSIAGDLLLTNAAEIYLHSGQTASPEDYGLLIAVAGGVTIGPSCWIFPFSHNTNGGSVHFDAAYFNVNAGGGINATASGFGGGLKGGIYNPPGYGPGIATVHCCQSPGAGYGGIGGDTASLSGGPTYGISNAPVDPGSGGGGAQTSMSGGNGGGLIYIEVTGTVIVDGSLLADGASPAGYAGAGSGGGIYVACRNFEGAGTGVLSADGGAAPGGQGPGSGGGGGGRIAVRYRDSTNSWTGTAEANGGTGKFEAGDDGTVVFWSPPPPGSVIWFK